MITAAVVQSVPVTVAALVAIYGLNTWRAQLRGQRQLKHAERAMAASDDAFGYLRAVRSRLMQYSLEDVSDRQRRRTALLDQIHQRLQRAWAARDEFNRHYARARLFATLVPGQIDVSSELADSLFELRGSAEVMLSYDEPGDDFDEPQTRADRKERQVFATKFYGSGEADKPDEMELRLRAAQSALRAELLPILNPPGWVEQIGRRIGQVVARGFQTPPLPTNSTDQSGGGPGPIVR